MKYPNELLFSGGGGAFAYQLGYAQGLIEIFGKSFFRNHHFIYGGVSAGIMVSITLHMAIYSEVQIYRIFELFVQRMYAKENKKFGVFAINQTAFNKTLNEFYDFCQLNNHQPFNSQIHTYITLLQKGRLKASLQDDFQSKESFISNIRASCFLPIITGAGLYYEHFGTQCVDGGILKPIPYRYEFEPNKKIFLDVLPEYSALFKKPFNLSSIDISKHGNIKFKDFLFNSEDYSEGLFERGLKSSLKYKNLLQEEFLKCE